eukprot:GILI01021474.1.p1 GENE.GILI01021474.1~~GILI01021474.1.p1  ORF type:complete len:464 (-),score=82.35 GILI01021474.1:131-1480(-)
MSYSPFDEVTKGVLTDGDGHATEVNFNAGETVADVLLEVEGVKVTEVTGGKRNAVIQGADLLILSMMPTAEELQLVNSQLGLPPNTISSDASETGKPFVFIVIGNYKLPLGLFIPTLQMDRYTFNFVVGPTFIEVVLPTSTQAEDLDAFPYIVGTYGDLRPHPKYQKESQAQVVRVDNRALTHAPPPPTQQGALVVHTDRDLQLYGAPPAAQNGVVAIHNPPTTSPMSTRVAGGITGIGRIATAVLARGSALIASGLGAGTDLIVSKTRPSQQPLNVPPNLKRRIEMTRRLTKGAAVVSGAMATSAISVAAVVGNVVGTNAAELLAGDGKEGNGNPKGKAVLEVGSAVFCTGAMIFSGLVMAKTQILTATGEGITKMVTHKLGGEAGGVAGNVVGIALDASAAATAASGGLKRKIAVAAAQSVVHQQQQLSQQQTTQQQLAVHTDQFQY